MNPKAVEGLGRILLLSDPKDVKLLEMKTVVGMPKSKSRREAIADILEHSETPGKLLRQQTIKKAVLNEYLKEIGVPDPKDLTKDDCIRSCLKTWGVHDDSMEKYRNEGEIHQALTRLAAERDKKIQKIVFQYENKMKSLLDSLKEINKQTLDSASSDASSRDTSCQFEKKKKRKKNEPLSDSLREIKKRSLDPSSPDASSSDSSPSSSTKFCFPKPYTPKFSMIKRKNASEDEISIVMEKRTKGSIPDVKVENVCVTPDIKPEPSAEGLTPTIPDSSDTGSVFWVNW